MFWRGRKVWKPVGVRKASSSSIMKTFWLSHSGTGVAELSSMEM